MFTLLFREILFKFVINIEINYRPFLWVKKLKRQRDENPFYHTGEYNIRLPDAEDGGSLRKDDVRISLFLEYKFLSLSIYTCETTRPTRIQREYRNANSWTGLEKSFTVPFPTSFRGQHEISRYVNSSIGFFEDAVRNLWKIFFFLRSDSRYYFPTCWVLLFYIYRFMLHCDSNEIADSFCSSSLIRTRLIFLLHFGNIFFPDFFSFLWQRDFLLRIFLFFFYSRAFVK